MPPTIKDKQPQEQNRRLSDQLKSWIPIVISVGAIIIGYILFKANTEYRLNTAENDIAELRNDLREAKQTIGALRETNINFNSRLRVLERQPIGDLGN
jgi:cell division protein FtsL